MGIIEDLIVGLGANTVQGDDVRLDVVRALLKGRGVDIATSDDSTEPQPTTSGFHKGLRNPGYFSTAQAATAGLLGTYPTERVFTNQAVADELGMGLPSVTDAVRGLVYSGSVNRINRRRGSGNAPSQFQTTPSLADEIAAKPDYRRAEIARALMPVLNQDTEMLVVDVALRECSEKYTPSGLIVPGGY